MVTSLEAKPVRINGTDSKKKLKGEMILSFCTAAIIYTFRMTHFENTETLTPQKNADIAQRLSLVPI